jgi:hypothetical protein
MEQGNRAFFFVELCTMEVISLRDVRSTISATKKQQIAEIVNPAVWRYVLEDGITIVRVQHPGDHSKDVLLRDQAAGMRDKNWYTPFLPFWGREKEDHESRKA